jgi:hypothetical protein
MAKSRGRSRFSKPGKDDAGATKEAKKEKKAAPPPRPKPRVPESGVPVVCSECYGDFLLSPETKKDQVTCPGCGHVGIIEEDTFQDISRQRQNHRMNFLLATAVTTLSFVLFLAFGLLNSWPFGAEKQKGGWTVPVGDETVNMVLLGLGVLLLLGGFFLVARYEKSRVEVYF